MQKLVDCKISSWGEGKPVIGKLYNFKKPVQVKSVCISNTGRQDNSPTERQFIVGRLIRFEDGIPVFTGHKLPKAKCKKSKTKYEFKIQ